MGGPSPSVKVMWGVVPVEEDGSANFYVPAKRNIYLQALDEDYRKLQRERTYVNYMPGETRSCIGCHERPHDTPPALATPPLAMRKPPAMPGPQPGDSTGRQVIHSPTYIQPVLDRHILQDADHEEVTLLRAEMVRFATWIDASGVFYGSYWGRRDKRFSDHPNYPPVPTFEQAIATVNPTPDKADFVVQQPLAYRRVEGLKV